jgi:hypothetical protein
LDEKAVALAVAVLMKAALKDLPGLRAQLKAAALDELLGYLLPWKPSAESAGPQNIGQLVEGRGVYLGPWTFDPKRDPVEAYSAPDFLRDRSGNQLVLNFREAVKELTGRNEGRCSGNGTEASLRQALSEGQYQDGDLVVAPMEFLNGRDAYGKTVRPDNNVCDLLRTTPAFETLRNAASGSSGDDRWSVSGSEPPASTSLVSHVRLTDGVVDWYNYFNIRSGVVPARVFHRANPQPGPPG